MGGGGVDAGCHGKGGTLSREAKGGGKGGGGGGVREVGDGALKGSRVEKRGRAGKDRRATVRPAHQTEGEIRGGRRTKQARCQKPSVAPGCQMASNGEGRGESTKEGQAGRRPRDRRLASPALCRPAEEVAGHCVLFTELYCTYSIVLYTQIYVLYICTVHTMDVVRATRHILNRFIFEFFFGRRETAFGHSPPVRVIPALVVVCGPPSRP